MEDPRKITALYLFLKRNSRQNARRRHSWIHQVFHCLLQELRLDDDHDLLGRIGPRISRQDTNYRRSISASARLSICKYLATGDSFRTIANSFRVGVSTVSIIVPEVAAAIWDCLVEEFMAVPTTEEWKSIAETFEAKWNFPLCCGALDGKHVVLKAPPPKSGSMFYNYKGTYYLVLLAVVDVNYCFQVIDTRHCQEQTTVGHSHTRFFADEAFPLRKNLMRPFPGCNIPREQKIFNYRLSRARMVVEDAFGILSSQWRMYRRAMEVRVDVAEKCVKATCVLHNFLRHTSTTARANNPTAEVEPLPGLGRVAANYSGREAIRVREVFTSYFSAEGAVPWQDSRLS
uniref:Zgc:194221 n=1 Tax=Gouania willdenowi TaxID=441366 RepID=A0A8C5EMV6_GOUWI